MEADFALESGCRIDPYNESPWRFFVAILQEQQNEEVRDWMVECHQKSASLRQVLVNAQRDPEKCINLTWARIDILEMVGDKASLEKVR